MSWMDRFKKGGQAQAGSEPPSPDQGIFPTPPQPAQTQEQAHFRGRENTSEEIPDEDAGLPSVNRRKSNHKAVTMMGFLVIMGLAGVA